MTFHTIEEANVFIDRMLTAMHNDDGPEFERLYFEALATSDPARPMFRIVNLLAINIVTEVRSQVGAEFAQADDLIRDAFKGVADPWQSKP